MDLDRLIRTALAIQAVPAPPFGEGHRAELIRELLAQAGLARLAMDDAGNVLGCVPGGNDPPVIVTAHMDSIFAAQEVRPAKRTRGQLVGPGIGDNAVAVAAMVEMGIDLVAKPAACPVWLVATTGEEGLGNLRGMRAVVDRFAGSTRAYIVLEGMALGRVYHRALPSERYRIEVTTAGGHSWIHYGHPSAIHLLVETLHSLLSLPIPEDPRSSFNIGTIQGGRGINSLAASATCEIELRSESAETLRHLVDELTGRIARQDGRDHKIDLIHLGSRPAGELPGDHILVRLAADAAHSATGRPAELCAGSTDASLPISLGLPAVCIGITRGGCAHSADEYVETSAIRQGFDAAMETIRRASRLS